MSHFKISRLFIQATKHRSCLRQNISSTPLKPTNKTERVSHSVQITNQKPRDDLLPGFVDSSETARKLLTTKLNNQVGQLPLRSLFRFTCQTFLDCRIFLTKFNQNSEGTSLIFLVFCQRGCLFNSTGELIGDEEQHKAAMLIKVEYFFFTKTKKLKMFKSFERLHI